MFLFSRFLLLLPLLFLLLSACSSSGEEEKAGTVERTTGKVAQEAINYIKTPIEQAKLAAELQESHNQLIEDAVKQQE